MRHPGSGDGVPEDGPLSRSYGALCRCSLGCLIDMGGLVPLVTAGGEEIGVYYVAATLLLISRCTVQLVCERAMMWRFLAMWDRWFLPLVDYVV
jgi:hypothetical protein